MRGACVSSSLSLFLHRLSVGRDAGVPRRRAERLRSRGRLQHPRQFVKLRGGAPRAARRGAAEAAGGEAEPKLRGHAPRGDAGRARAITRRHVSRCSLYYFCSRGVGAVQVHEVHWPVLRGQWEPLTAHCKQKAAVVKAPERASKRHAPTRGGADGDASHDVHVDEEALPRVKLRLRSCGAAIGTAYGIMRQSR